MNTKVNLAPRAGRVTKETNRRITRPGGSDLSPNWARLVAYQISIIDKSGTFSVS